MAEHEKIKECISELVESIQAEDTHHALSARQCEEDLSDSIFSSRCTAYASLGLFLGFRATRLKNPIGFKVSAGLFGLCVIRQLNAQYNPHAHSRMMSIHHHNAQIEYSYIWRRLQFQAAHTTELEDFKQLYQQALSDRKQVEHSTATWPLQRWFYWCDW